MVVTWCFFTFLLLALVNFLDTIRPFQLINYSYGSFFHYYVGTDIQLSVFLRTWGWHFLHIGQVLLVLASVLGYADMVSPWLWKRAPRAHRLVEKCGLGLGGAAISIWGLGLCGLLNAWTMWILILPGVAYLVIYKRNHLSAEVRECTAGIVWRNHETKFLLGAISLMGAVCLLMSLGPEGGWDARYYHLQLPKLYAMRHKVFFVPYIYPGGFPQAVEMLYGLGWLIGKEETAKLINFAFWPLSGIALYRLALPFGTNIALRAVALAMTLPLIGTEASENYVDLALSFFVILSLLEAWRGNPFSAGMFLGFAMGSKYTGIIPALALGAALILLRRPFRSVLVVAVTSAVAMLPWLVKNGLFTGNPIAPFFHAQLATMDWAWGIDQIAINRWEPSRLIGEHGTGIHSSLLIGLWNFLQEKSFAVLSPFVLGLFPAIILRSSTSYHGYLKVFVVISSLVVLALCPAGKFYMPVLFPLCVLVGWTWMTLGEAGKYYRAALNGIAIFSIAFCVIYHMLDMHRVLPKVYGVALGFEDRSDYYRRMRHPPGYYDAVTYLNKTVPASERIAIISDVEAYLLDREAVFDPDIPDVNRWIYLLTKRQLSAVALNRQFKQWNARTVLYMREKAASVGKAEDWSPDAVESLSEFWKRRAILKGEWGSCAVYELSPVALAKRPKLDLPGPQEQLLAVMQTMDWDRKRSAYEQGISLGLESAYIHGTYGAWAINMGAKGDAIQALGRAVEIEPKHAQFWYWLSPALIMGGKTDEARKALSQAVTLDPNDPLRARLESVLGKVGGDIRR